MYVDKELGELTPQEANTLIEQYHDAIADDSSGQIQLMGSIEYLNSYIARVTMNIDMCSQVYDPRLVESLNQALKDGNIKYIYEGEEIDNEQLDEIRNKLTQRKIQQKELIQRYNKDNDKKSVINWDWFLDACLSMSQVFEYAVKIDDLSVKAFCLLYKRFVKQVEKMNSKTKTNG